ncbi:hypothetical protein [Streptomyces sp. NPDC002564]|uniref:hypothetical protein n=1 Tax=Streptomyces sp. NPDC002564 TaxID=3364649 RepID=UPI003696DDE9
MNHVELPAFLAGLRQAARTGGDLSVASAADAARLLSLDALTVSLRSEHGVLELLWADYAHALGPALDDLQFTVGEGPTPDAARTRLTVVAGDLTSTPAERWPLFSPAARALPAGAVIAVPLLLGLATVGVVTGSLAAPAPFPADQRQDLARFSRVALDLVLHTPVRALDAGNQGRDLHRAAVHQAAGILTVQLGVGVGVEVGIDEALVRLRAYAWRADLPLLHVARAVIAGRLHLAPDG